MNSFDKVHKTVAGETQNWPYEKLEHWPPMTYRDTGSVNTEDLLSFKDFLSNENGNGRNKELQPWIPFCLGQCIFCYFPVCCSTHDVPLYLKAMKKSLSFYAESRYVQSSVFNELYVGGGTPTVLSKGQIADLLQYCRKNFNFNSDASTKIAACTTSLSEEKTKFLSAQKIQQIDVGVQTFDDSNRRLLKLQDNSLEVKQKLKIARKNNLRVSIDLLYNLPGQKLEQWENDLKQALELEVESVDCYPLDLYPGTPLAKKIESGDLPSLNDDSTELEMYLSAATLFKKNGYFTSCHNRFTRLKEDLEEPSSEVIGSGAGFFMGRIDKFIYSDTNSVHDYVLMASSNKPTISNLTKLTVDEEMKNAMMLIYVRIPVDRRKFKMRFGVFPEEAFPEAIRKLKEKQLIEVADDKIRLSEKGDPWRFNIAWEFVKN
jgi:coproporphyrinogen III oxidase-like Fe-S oxidoreductase